MRDSGLLDVCGGHRVDREESGNPNGIRAEHLTAGLAPAWVPAVIGGASTPQGSGLSGWISVVVDDQRLT